MEVELTVTLISWSDEETEKRARPIFAALIAALGGVIRSHEVIHRNAKSYVFGPNDLYR